MLLGFLVLALPTEAAICHNGCSGHGSCGLLGSCICEGNWAGRDCSFQLSLDADLPAPVSGNSREEETLDTAALLDETPRGPPKRSALAFAQSRRAAESAWATADKCGDSIVHYYLIEINQIQLSNYSSKFLQLARLQCILRSCED